MSCCGCVTLVTLQGEHQRRLYKDLMQNYNPLERPVYNDSHSLTVHFGFSLMQIMDVVSSSTVYTYTTICLCSSTSYRPQLQHVVNAFHDMTEHPQSNAGKNIYLNYIKVHWKSVEHKSAIGASGR